MARILLVDDDRFMLRFGSEVLALGGHEVCCAKNGREALDLLNSGTFDLVITDVFMPEMDGFEVMLHLRKAHPELPVITQSAGAPMSGVAPLRIAEKLGAGATIGKPYRPESLLSLVGSVLQTSTVGTKEG